MLLFEFLHRLNQCLHAFDRHSVVERSAETAHRTVALDADHASSSGKVCELFLQLLVLVVHHEANVHQRAVFDSHRSAEQLVAVDLVIQHGCLLLVLLLKHLNAALLLIPLQGLQRREDRQYGRRVEHRILLDVCAIVQHRGERTVYVAQRVFANDDDRHTSRSEVLLCTGINGVVFREVNREGEDV